MTRILSAFNLLKRVGFAVLLLGICSFLHAQPPDTSWTRSFGLTGEDEQFYSVCPRGGGGVVLAGGGRIDASWQAERGILIALLESGDTAWARSYADVGMHNLKCVIPTSDGGYLAAGRADVTRFKVVKTDQSGLVEWTHLSEYPAFGTTEVAELEMPDSCLVVAHSADSDSLPNIYVTFLEPDGDTIMVRRYGGISIDRIVSLELTDSGFVLLGSMDRFNDGIGFHQNAYALFVNQSGDVQALTWLDSDNDDWATSGARDSLGGYVVAGLSYSDTSEYTHVFVARFGHNGQIEWERRYSEITSSPSGMISLSGGGVILCGTGERDPYLFSLNSEGGIEWMNSYPLQEPMIALDVSLGNDGSIYVAGIEIVANSDRNISVIRLDDSADVSDPRLPINYLLLGQNYPNPFNSSTNISFTLGNAGDVSLRIHNCRGQLVSTNNLGFLNAGSYSVTVQLSELGSGTYFYSVQTNLGRKVRRMTLLK